MNNYNFKDKWKKLLTPDIYLMLAEIHELKGEQKLHIEKKPETLESLVKVAKIQSIEYSNKIEGIFTSDKRLKELTIDKTNPENRDEKEIAGYRDVLNTIHENHEYIPIRPTYINQLHKDLYKFSGSGHAGKYKSTNNYIQEVDNNGNAKVRFQPIDVWDTPEAMDKLCEKYNEIINSHNSDSLLIIPMFILDFLCIHPYSDGNGRMSRLLTLLLLYKTNYIVGKYISLEKIIENSKETYYEVLEISSRNWHENENDYEPFVKYYLGIILNAYREFSQRIETLTNKDFKKTNHVELYIKQKLGKVTKQELIKNIPSVSDTTIQRTLNSLIKDNKIIKIGGGRYTEYTYNRENE